MVAIVLVTADLLFFIYRITCRRTKIESFEGNIKYERDIFDIIEQDFWIPRTIVSVLLLFSSIYIYIFINSLIASVKEFRQRLYAIAKL